MKSLFSFIALAVLATSAFGQSEAQINAAVRTVGPPGVTGISPQAFLAYGIIDQYGAVLASGHSGVLALATGTTIGGSSVVALGTITSSSANALTVGRAGATNPAFNVDASTSSSATGINVKAAAAAGGVAVKALSSGTDESMTIDAKGAGTITLNGTATGVVNFGTTATANNATTPSFVTAAGKTNTGNFTVNGKTSGKTVFTTADSTAQTVTHTTAAQTVGGSTVTIPNMLGVSASFGFNSSAVLTAGSTPAFAPGAGISMYTLTPGEAETWAATTTGAIAGKVYYVRILTSGTSSYTLTFGSNMKSTGTLATGTADAKVFVIAWLFDGTNFCEVSRTTAM